MNELLAFAWGLAIGMAIPGAALWVAIHRRFRIRISRTRK